MRIIQISGKGRVGKTTLAHLIAKACFAKGYIPVIIPFAKSLKDEAKSLGYDKDTDPENYRKFCQKLGAERRKENEDYWVTKTFGEIQEYMVKELDNKKQNKNYWEYVIIQDDVRYMNELALGRDLVATQIFIDSGNRRLEDQDGEWRTHESETLANVVEESFSKNSSDYEELFDFVLVNGGSIKYLEQYVKDDLTDWLDLGFLELEEIKDDEAE